MSFCTYLLLVLVPIFKRFWMVKRKCMLSFLGSAKLELDDRIANGLPAAPGQFPYEVSLRERLKHFCGGSIITHRLILTAAHCTVTVHAGTITLDTQGYVYHVQEEIIHPQFDNITYLYDIGLIKTTSYINYIQNKVQPIQTVRVLPVKGIQCVVSGWGVTGYPYGTQPNNLLYLITTFIGWESCQAIRPSKYVVHPSHICTHRGLGYSQCYGDSGSPLVADGVQFGIVSTGADCSGRYAIVHANVAFLSGWLDTYTDPGCILL